jgi:ribosome biogenesis GTPase A
MQKDENKGMIQRRTRILIVGIPNVGKSTLINRLVGKKATNVANKPGVTKQLDWIRINEKFELLDSPGILWPKLDEERVALNLAALTAIKEEVLPLYDVVEYVLRSLEQFYPKVLFDRYTVNHIEDDFIETLEIIGKKRGCLIKGGEIDYDKVISIIINEIKSGILKGITFDRTEEHQ